MCGGVPDGGADEVHWYGGKSAEAEWDGKDAEEVTEPTGDEPAETNGRSGITIRNENDVQIA